jgi:hypothetical protein
MANNILSNRYDLGDVAGSILMYTSIVAWTGIGSPSIYGVNLTESAFAAGGLTVPMYTVGMGTAVLIAFLTNGQLTANGLMKRPTWELAAVIGTVAFPVIVDNLSLLEDFMLRGHLEGTAFALLALAGYVIVAFRRDNDSKASIGEAARALATQG